MKIIIFGPPGSGKGTQSNLIMQKYNIPIISIGDILRNIMLKKNQLGMLIKKKIQTGMLIDDNIIIDLLMEKIQNNSMNSFILDGFPRTIKQTKIMNKKNIVINYIIELTLNKKILYERILGRRIHIPSGRIYHVKYNPPNISEQDDITHEKLTTRIDDNIQTIHQRLCEYQNMHEIMMKYFHTIKNNKITKYTQINTEKSIQNVFSKIKKFIKLNKNL
ncbi:nucleoside monophosphate kinase [Buchnera aphidicola (Takecallis taiwana)]|uniref:nucleoside monophosphate kinase n=1 Tax=Buchnera aphidicola TaxID=9 RepID=UPI0031B71DFC